jgi:CRISPR-associated protein Csd1
MILQALDGYYHRLAGRDEPPVPIFGYTYENISFALVIQQDGKLLDVTDLRRKEGRTSVPASICVPQSFKRPGTTPRSFFLWDKTSFVLGVKADKAEKTKVVETPREHAAFRKLHEDLLAETEDEGLRAVLGFLATWTPGCFEALSGSKDILDTNLVFRLEGELRYIHQRPAAQEVWAKHLAGKNGADGLCLLSGMSAPLARLHPAIKGVRGAQSTGGSIVSFNLDAFTSFGKEQGANAPVSEQAAFAYTTAVNYLLRPGDHNRQRLQIADASTVFWAEARSPDDDAAAEAAEDLFGLLAAPSSEETLDAQEAAKIADVLEKIAAGRPLQQADPRLNPGTRFFVLGLAPNAARLSVRFWHVDELGTLAERFRKHWQDLAIEPRPWKTAPAIWRLLYETAAQRKAENIPPNLSGEVMRAILTGGRYPRTLLAEIVMRCRADRDLNGMRAAILKACIVRDDRKRGEKESIPVSLDPHETNAGYRLGRCSPFWRASSARRSARSTRRSAIATTAPLPRPPGRCSRSCCGRQGITSPTCERVTSQSSPVGSSGKWATS